MSTVAIVIAAFLAFGVLAIVVVALLPTGGVPRIAPNSLDQSGILHGLLSGVGG